jgi:hypothetical protein
MDISLCGIDCWNESKELSDAVDYRFLAKSTGLSISILFTYIVFFTKMQKRHTPKIRLAFLISENTTSRFLANEKIYCSNLESGFLTAR